MRRRLSENAGATKLIRETEDFVIRGSSLSRGWLLAGFAGTIGILLLMFGLSLRGEVLGVGFHVLIAVLLLAFLMFLFYKLYTQIAVAEFQSLVFSNILRSDSVFCLVFRPDGTLLYQDNRYFDVFPEGDPSRVAGVLFDAGLEPTDAEWLQEGIREHTMASVLIELVSDKEELRSASLAVLPLTRPKGFFALRAADT